MTLRHLIHRAAQRKQPYSVTRAVTTAFVAPAEPRLGDGVYVTDGRRLFRVALPISHGTHSAIAILEDCETLSLTAVSSAELSGMRLTAVTASHP